MNLCSYNHSEICFEERKCPFCESIEEYEGKLDAITDQVAELEAKVQELESKLEDAQ